MGPGDGRNMAAKRKVLPLPAIEPQYTTSPYHTAKEKFTFLYILIVTICIKTRNLCWYCVSYWRTLVQLNVTDIMSLLPSSCRCSLFALQITIPFYQRGYWCYVQKGHSKLYNRSQHLPMCFMKQNVVKSIQLAS